MALRIVLRRLRNYAPPLVHRLSGDCLEGLAQYGNPQSTLVRRASTWNVRSLPVLTSNAERLSFQRGYGREAPLADRDNGCIALDSPSHSTLEETSGSPKEPTLNMGPKISERHNLAMIFTCTVCQTRLAKTMSRQTYEKGVVIVRCGGCKNLHLIADRLGWFGEPGSVEDFLKHKGMEVRKGSEESYEFSAEDLAGWSPPEKD